MDILLLSEQNKEQYVPLTNVRMLTVLGEDTLVWYNPVWLVESSGNKYNSAKFECELVRGFNKIQMRAL